MRPVLPLPGDIHPFTLDPDSGVVRWTRDGFGVLARQGLLDGQAHELVDGRIVGLETDAALDWVVRRLARRLQSAHGMSAVRLRSPLALSAQSEPKPSLTVLHDPGFGGDRGRVPAGVDALLVVDVRSGTDLAAERIPVFSLGGVSEYWLVDVGSRTIARHRFPERSGYGLREVWGETQSVPGMGLDSREFRVCDILLSPV